MCYVDAARAFIPVTGTVPCGGTRLRRLSDQWHRSGDRDVRGDDHLGGHTLDALPAEPSAEWRKAAPERLHALTTAFDRIDLEGPPQQASARELAEELGIRVLPQAVFHPTDGESK